MRVLIFFVVLYSLFIYVAFMNEPSDGWKGTIHKSRYPFAFLAPPLMIYAVVQTFRGK